MCEYCIDSFQPIELHTNTQLLLQAIHFEFGLVYSEANARGRSFIIVLLHYTQNMHLDTHPHTHTHTYRTHAKTFHEIHSRFNAHFSLSHSLSICVCVHTHTQYNIAQAYIFRQLSICLSSSSTRSLVNVIILPYYHCHPICYCFRLADSHHITCIHRVCGVCVCVCRCRLCTCSTCFSTLFRSQSMY